MKKAFCGAFYSQRQTNSKLQMKIVICRFLFVHDRIKSTVNDRFLTLQDWTWKIFFIFLLLYSSCEMVFNIIFIWFDLAESEREKRKEHKQQTKTRKKKTQKNRKKLRFRLTCWRKKAVYNSIIKPMDRRRKLSS